MNTYQMSLLAPGIVPTLDSVPYAGITSRYANNCLTCEEQEAIWWLEEYFKVKRGDLLRERQYAGEISIDLRRPQFRYGPIIEEFFWELGIPLKDRGIWYQNSLNSFKLFQVILYYKTNIPGIINEGM